MEKIVKGATKIKLAAPKSKYIEPILSATNGGDSGVAEVFRTLQIRLRDSTWTIVFKSLIVVHLMIREGQPEVTLRYIADAPKRMAISTFAEVQTQGLNIRRYYEYLMERVRAYRDTKTDFVKSGTGKMRRLTVDKGLLRQTEVVQDQIEALLRCDLLNSHDPDNEITLTAFRLLTMDLLELFRVMNEGTINVLEHYFEMSRPDAERALQIYKTFGRQTEQVVQYLSLARQYEMSTRLEVPKLKHAPTTLTASLEEYLNDPDFEMNRRQYLAQQEAKRTGKPMPSATTSKAFEKPPNMTAQNQARPQAQQQQQQPKGPAPDLIDFFDSIEQYQQPIVHPQQEIQTGMPQAQPYQHQQQQHMQMQMPQQTGFNPFLQQQQQQHPPTFQNQSLPQPTPLQTDLTGAGFGGYGPQPPQPPQHAFQFQSNLSPIPQNGVAGFQSQALPSPQPTSTNPFRQSMMPTGSSQTSSMNAGPTRQSTNPFAKHNTGAVTQNGPGFGTGFDQSFSPSPISPEQTFTPTSSFASQPAQLQPQRTGTNPFAKNRPATATAPLTANVTGSTNPFRQSAFFEMDEDGADVIPTLSIIPYDTNRDVVLRHADTIVYRDPQTNQLVPFHHDRAVERRPSDCPTCGRPLHSQGGPSTQDSTSSPREDQPSFITHDYFDMLARSLPGSNETSAPPSPRRYIAQPLRSRLSTSSSPAVSTPPPDIEFVASAPAPPSLAHGISETAFSPNYFERFFVEERELGRGGRGVVLLVKHVLDGVNLGYFACKRVPIGDDHGWLEKVLVEVQLLQGLSHQNLVSYRHVWLEDYQISTFGPSVPCAFILQQYCNGGDMHNYVLGSAQAITTTQELKERIRRRSKGESEIPRRPNEPKSLPFDEIYNFFRDITSGLRFLHHSGFIHRDLKPSNCLLHTAGGETRVLVSDFGEVQYEYATRKSTGATGTISYCAPEVLRRISPTGPFQNFTSKSDIFSLGMILHFLCFASLPYNYANVLHEEREDVDQLRAEIMAWEGFDDQRKARPELPAALYTFLKRLLSLDPEQRPSADDVLQVVQSGRLDDIPAARRRGSMEPEELTPGRRIQKLDTPQKGNSPQGRGLHDSLGSPKSPRGPRYRQNNNRSVSPERKLSKGGTSADTNTGTTTSPVLRPQLLLEPPAHAQGSEPEQRVGVMATLSSINRMLFGWVNLNQPITTPSTRLLMLGLKLLSTLQPCMSYGMNASLVYPLICLALLEFAVPHIRVWQATAMMMVHFGVLAVALRMDKLCQRRP
ncbi:putative serine/threonine-protein kinase iks1 [Exophiala xenobiotica]|nr:putative serine/threonine-protein kinase iks1 [Exophiala xenobiotica]